MGLLTLPVVGTVYLDANAIIYSVEGPPIYWDILQPLWIAVQSGSLIIVGVQAYQ